MRLLICLEKYSDFLEAYSIFHYFGKFQRVDILYLENERNNSKAVEGMFNEFKVDSFFSYISCSNKLQLFEIVSDRLQVLQKGDVAAMPFVRYRDFWALVPFARTKGIITVHLSETFPDSFGLIGYRIAFRMGGKLFSKKNLKQMIGIIPMYLYALMHKPDLCFYNLMPYVHNPFVKETVQAVLPKISEYKRNFLQNIVGDKKRPLLVSGFGYDLDKMVKYLNIQEYIATSKNKEIIIDGKIIPLDEFICAEEVMLSGCIDEVIGYNSTAIGWALLIGNIKIACYESTALNRQYGFFNGSLTRKTLKKCGICLLGECKYMIN